MHGLYGNGKKRSAAMTSRVRGQNANLSENRRLWAIKLENQETGKCLDIDGIVLTWFTRNPEEAIRDLMEGRNPELWEPRLERVRLPDEDMVQFPTVRERVGRRARRLRLGAGIVRDEAPAGKRTHLRDEARALTNVLASGIIPRG
ncbi:hypothetical protein [Amaricoccus macauensis]|uniref:hypothetical protein n=1 Tax=Amaricoccus macauensis TaxID=57001 RepID=UPI003C7E1F96